MEKLRINVISESESVPGQGVDTAFHEMVNALRRNSDAEVFVNSEEHCDIVHLHTFGSYALRVLLRKKKDFGLRVVTAHLIPESLIGSIRLAKYYMPVMRAYMRFFYGRAEIVFAISDEVKKALINELKIPESKIRLLYNCVDMQKYALTADDKTRARAKFSISPEQFVVVGIGQTQPRKRLDSFIAVARQMPEASFIWLGGIPFKALGAESGKITALIKSAPDNVKFTGIIDHAEVHDYLAASDVFFLPSEQENHPMCVLEAAGAGLPIVLRDIIEYNDTFKGDALMADNDDNFVKILSDLKDSGNYAAAVAGSKRIADRFDAPAFSQQLLSYYQELLTKGEKS